MTKEREGRIKKKKKNTCQRKKEKRERRKRNCVDKEITRDGMGGRGGWGWGWGWKEDASNRFRNNLFYVCEKNPLFTFMERI